MSYPINLPGRVLSGSPISAGWANSIREAIARLANRSSALEAKSNLISAPPFTVSVETTNSITKLSVASGRWQEGAAGTWTTIDATEATEGTHVYLVINQDEDSDIVDPFVTIEINEGYEDVLLLSESSPYHVTEARVLLAEYDSVNKQLTQYRHGNFTLGIWQIDGSVTRWPENVAGTRPPPPAP